MAPEIPKTMKAWRYARFGGGADALELAEDVPVPEAKAGQVLARVQASSVNLIDIKLQEGGFRPLLPFALPFIPGLDFAGEVVAVGPNVESYAVGDQILGGYELTGGAALAEYVVVPVTQIAKRPASVPAVEGACFAVAGMAALQGLRDAGGLPLGRKLEEYDSVKQSEAPLNVAIANSTGGVGLYAVQLAKLVGAHVTATCGERNVEFVTKLGVDEALDYKTEEGKTLKSPSGKKYSTLLDGTMTLTWAQVKPVLVPGGKWAHLTPSPSLFALGLWAMLSSKQRVQPVLSAPKATDLAILAKLAAEGKLKTVIDSEFPFSEAPDAWKKVAAGRILGKVVVRMP